MRQHQMLVRSLKLPFYHINITLRLAWSPPKVQATCIKSSSKELHNSQETILSTPKDGSMYVAWWWWHRHKNLRQNIWQLLLKHWVLSSYNCVRSNIPGSFLHLQLLRSRRLWRPWALKLNFMLRLLLESNSIESLRSCYCPSGANEW